MPTADPNPVPSAHPIPSQPSEVSTPSAAAARPSAAPAQRRVVWVGGIVNVRTGGPQRVSTRIAMWMMSDGTVLDAAIVTSGGPVVLREMFDELLTRVPGEQRPSEVTVWPAAKARFRDLEYPDVEIRKDLFLKIVADDQADAGFFPWDLTTRSPSS